MAAGQPTDFHWMYLNPCGSWLASDGGLTANQFVLATPNQTVGASLLAMAV
jgi:hypothetical protein